MTSNLGPGYVMSRQLIEIIKEDLPYCLKKAITSGGPEDVLLGHCIRDSPAIRRYARQFNGCQNLLGRKEDEIFYAFETADETKAVVDGQFPNLLSFHRIRGQDMMDYYQRYDKLDTNGTQSVSKLAAS